MICLSSAGSLAPFDGGGSMQTTPAIKRTPFTAPHAFRRRRTARRRTRARQRESLWYPDGKAKGTNQRPLALRGDATSTPMRPLGAHLEANPRNARTAVTPHARPEHAPHSPTSASGAQPNAPQRPAPDAWLEAPRWVGNSTRRNILPSETWKCHMRSKSR